VENKYYIEFVGPEGAGKTTVAKLVVEHLNKKGLYVSARWVKVKRNFYSMLLLPWYLLRLRYLLLYYFHLLGVDGSLSGRVYRARRIFRFIAKLSNYNHKNIIFVADEGPINWLAATFGNRVSNTLIKFLFPYYGWNMIIIDLNAPNETCLERKSQRFKKTKTTKSSFKIKKIKEHERHRSRARIIKTIEKKCKAQNVPVDVSFQTPADIAQEIVSQLLLVIQKCEARNELSKDKI